jgi:hypothetical protein
MEMFFEGALSFSYETTLDEGHGFSRAVNAWDICGFSR